METQTQVSYDERDTQCTDTLFIVQSRRHKFRVRRHDNDCLMLYFVAWSDSQFRITVPPCYTLFRRNDDDSYQPCHPVQNDTYYMWRIHDYQLCLNGHVIWSMYDTRRRNVTLSDDVTRG